MDKFRHIDTWLFDLDNTLYDAETGIFTKVGDRMTDFIVNLLKMSHEDANALRKDYWKKYGTTLQGLMVEQAVDPHAFLHYAHDIDISEVPQCGITIEHLKRLPGRKIIFTNGPRHWATRMTEHLGIGRHFDHIFAIEDAGFLTKPHIDAYHAVIKKFRFDPHKTCMFEDMEINLKPAADLGMTTVWCHGKNQAPDQPHIHHKTEKLADWLLATSPKPREDA